MSFLSVVVNVLFSDLLTTFISLSIGYVVYKLAKLYLQVWSLPPGPIPLPLIGNILKFRTPEHGEQVLRQFNKKYGPLFTLWLGTNPFVFITDIEIAREAFGKKDFTGRPQSFIGHFLSNGEYQDVAMTDYGPTWEALRKVTHSAAIKYSKNDKLVYLVCDVVDNTIKTIVEKEGLNREFNPNNYLYLLFLNILANCGLGKNYSIEDEEFKLLKYALKDIRSEAGSWFILWEFSPLARLIDRKMVKKYEDTTKNIVDIMNVTYKSHYKDYDESIERDFCDALISAKNDALREGKESAKYLTEQNLAMCVYDLLFAGTETSQQTFVWLLLLLTYYPEVHKKLRQEIESEIGDRIPTHEDRNRCHYVMAVISESMRLRNASPTSLPHKAVIDSKIGDYKIPKGNGLIVYHGIILTDEKHWPNAQEFRPERFLENGKYITTRPKAYIPFGIGRRVCLGERLAVANIFLVLVRFLQKTSEYDLSLGTNNGIEPDPNNTDSYSPFEYKIIFKAKSNSN